MEATRNGVTTRYIYDANGNLLAEADVSNTITRYYIYGDGLLGMVTSGGALYSYHFDGTGHTVALTDTSANVVNKYAYTPFGTIAGQQEIISQPFKYVGKYGVVTESNGFNYMKARYYDPQVGRFLSEDPKGFEGGDVNLMAYVGNQPIDFLDPLGTDKISATLGIASFVGGAVSLIPHPVTIAAGRLVGATSAVASVAYASYQVSKDNKLSFDSGSSIALAAGDIAVLMLQNKFPVSTAFYNMIARPLNNINTVKDTVQSFGQGNTCGK